MQLEKQNSVENKSIKKQFDVEITAVKEIRGRIKYQVKPLD